MVAPGANTLPFALAAKMYFFKSRVPTVIDTLLEV